MYNPIEEKKKYVKRQVEKSFDNGISVNNDIEKAKWKVGDEKQYNGVTYFVSGLNAKGNPLWRKKKDGGGGTASASNNQQSSSSNSDNNQAQNHPTKKSKWKVGDERQYNGVTYVVSGLNAKGTPQWKKKREGSSKNEANDSSKNTDSSKISSTDYYAKKVLDLMQIQNNKYNDISKVSAIKTDKGNWAMHYDGKNTGLIIGGAKLSELELKKLGIIDDDDRNKLKNKKSDSNQDNNSKSSDSKSTDLSKNKKSVDISDIPDSEVKNYKELLFKKTVPSNAQKYLDSLMDDDELKNFRAVAEYYSSTPKVVTKYTKERCAKWLSAADKVIESRKEHKNKASQNDKMSSKDAVNAIKSSNLFSDGYAYGKMGKIASINLGEPSKSGDIQATVIYETSRGSFKSVYVNVDSKGNVKKESGWQPSQAFANVNEAKSYIEYGKRGRDTFNLKWEDSDDIKNATKTTNQNKTGSDFNIVGARAQDVADNVASVLGGKVVGDETVKVIDAPVKIKAYKVKVGNDSFLIHDGVFQRSYSQKGYVRHKGFTIMKSDGSRYMTYKVNSAGNGFTNAWSTTAGDVASHIKQTWGYGS